MNPDDSDMKLTNITTWILPLTSKVAYHMSVGKTCDTVDTVVVRFATDSGRHGWGEVRPIPNYLPAYAGGVIPAIAEIAPAILGS